jgi:hypothetical protein
MPCQKDFGVVRANVGFFSKMALRLAPQAHVYAIEPVPITLECFQFAAFRNYADVGEGPMPIMDCLMVNRLHTW